MSHRRRDVPGGLGLSLGLRVGGPLLGGGSDETSIFDWNVESLIPLPGSFTYARNAPVQTLTTIDGSTYWYQEIEADEFHYTHMRRVYNHLRDLSLWSLVGGVTRNGDDYTWPSNGYITSPVDAFASLVDKAKCIFSVEIEPAVGTTTLDVQLRVFDSGTPKGDVTVAVASSGVTKIQTSFELQDIPTALSVRVGENIKTNDTYTITNAMFEFAQDLGDAASEFVVYQGGGFQSAQWRATTNGNSVVANVVTSGAGNPIIGGGYLPQPATTNQVTDPDDLSTVNWTLTNILTPTDLGTDTIGLRTWQIDAGVAAGIHTIGQTIAGTGDSSASVRARAIGGGAQFLTLRLDASPTADYAVIDLIGGTITEDTVATKIKIENLGGGWFEFGFGKTGATARDIVIGVSNTGTPGTAEPSFTAANEQFALAIPQVEAIRHVTAPVVGIRSTHDDLLIETPYEDEVSIIVDSTFPVNPSFNSLTADQFSNNRFYMSTNTGVRSQPFPAAALLVSNAGLEGERHKVACSWKDDPSGNNIVDDEDNDNTGSVSGTDWSGRSWFLGLRTSTQMWNGIIHRYTVKNVALDVDGLKQETAPP